VRERNNFEVIELYPVGRVSKTDISFQEIEIFQEFLPALDSIENFEYLWILFWLHQVSQSKRRVLKVHPRGDIRRPERGVFSTHSPVRPNPIGLTRVRLLKRENNILRVEELDALINSPVIDIKSRSAHSPLLR